MCLRLWHFGMHAACALVLCCALQCVGFSPIACCKIIRRGAHNNLFAGAHCIVSATLHGLELSALATLPERLKNFCWRAGSFIATISLQSVCTLLHCCVCATACSNAEWDCAHVLRCLAMRRMTSNVLASSIRAYTRSPSCTILSSQMCACSIGNFNGLCCTCDPTRSRGGHNGQNLMCAAGAIAHYQRCGLQILHAPVTNRCCWMWLRRGRKQQCIRMKSLAGPLSPLSGGPQLQRTKAGGAARVTALLGSNIAHNAKLGAHTGCHKAC